MNKINLELEIKKLARIFAEKQNIKVEVFFNRPPGSKYNEEGYRHRGFCDSRTVPGLHQIYINLKRDTGALIFRTLAHELAHAWQWEVGKNKKHNLSFWQTLDDYTLPFVLENLTREDREELTNLLNPTTNRHEENDGVHGEAEERIISFSLERENINEQGKVIRQETMKGNLGFKTYVSTKKTSHDKYRILIYFNESEGEVARILERLGELEVDETEVRVK